ncbi:MAG TPA: hypothetical protein PKA05_07230 [Roseiflexaceae bacterium]|nr:hypothetical protein [Roseiflexaceae bacterium]HMP40155.1 hypothetical protein [Roseiflexaceae bacterium]
MSLYTPEGTPPVLTGAMARIERRLPHSGEVIVRVGQRVEPDEVIARAYLPGAVHIVNVARELMIAPAQVVRAVHHEIGAAVEAGAVLARSGRIGGRTCSSPVFGKLVAIDGETGYVTIIADPARYEIEANIRGIVMEVIPYIGVLIETPAAQVYGAFGIGNESAGVLRLLVTDPAEPILPEMLNTRSAYAIIIGGSGISAAALQRAVAEQVRGVIVGSIDEAELRAFLGMRSIDAWRTGTHSWRFPREAGQPPLTIVVTEGFGDAPMSLPIFELLASHDRQEALIEGMTLLRRPLRRPRIVIPLSARTQGIQIDPPRPPLRPGATVRLLDPQHLGTIARVQSISATPTRLPSRLRVPSLTVALEDGTTLVLPQQTVEVLA